MTLTDSESQTLANAPVNATAKKVATAIHALHVGFPDELSVIDHEMLANFLDVSTRTLRRAMKDLLESGTLVALPSPEVDDGLYLVKGDQSEGWLRAANSDKSEAWRAVTKTSKP